MRRFVDREESRAFDRAARETCAVPGIVLMENAGHGATALLLRTLLSDLPQESRTEIVAGVGNNGGDGFVIARQLLACGRGARVLVVGDESRVTGDARTMLDALRGIGGGVEFVDAESAASKLEATVPKDAVVVDALFGTGLDRPLAPPFVELVGAINRLRAPRFALDLPSGLDADTGRALGAAVMAKVTATFGQMKCGLLTPNGAGHAGDVHVISIGVPVSSVGGASTTGDWLEREDLARFFAPRAPGVHKNTSGHLLVVAGSRGKSGAALLCARGAMRAGAGLVTVASWPDAIRDIELRSIETMTDALTTRSMAELMKGKRALVIGPGLGLDAAAERVIEEALILPTFPIVLDADALTLMARRLDKLRARPSLVLTPHPGELGRLLGISTEEVESDRFSAVRRAAHDTGAVVVLKGAHTLIASATGQLAASPVAAPSLATAGSGDVLAGVIGALLGVLGPFEAACAGVLLHGFSGADWQERHGDRGMLASEIADGITGVLATLRP